MKKIQVVPLISVNAIKFGWTRQELHDKIGLPERTIEKADYYQDSSLLFSVHLDENERIEFVEISNPNSNQFQILLDDIDIFNTEADKLIEQIQKKMKINYDSEDSEIPYSFTFPAIELALWRPTIPEEEEDEDGKYFESVGLGIKGYYSEIE